MATRQSSPEPPGRVKSLKDLRVTTSSSTLEKDVLRVIQSQLRRDGSRLAVLLQHKVSVFFTLDILLQM